MPENPVGNNDGLPTLQSLGAQWLGRLLHRVAHPTAPARITKGLMRRAALVTLLGSSPDF
jgi:hypothetical protein